MSVVCIARRRKSWLYLLEREHRETESFLAHSPRCNGRSEDGDHEEYDNNYDENDNDDDDDNDNDNDEEEKAHLCVDLLLIVAGAEGRKDQVSVVHHLSKIFFITWAKYFPSPEQNISKYSWVQNIFSSLL